MPYRVEPVGEQQPDSELRLATAKSHTPTWPLLGLASLGSRLSAAKKLEPAVVALIGGQAGLSGHGDENYDVVGAHNGRRARVSFYLVTGIASVRVRTMDDRSYGLSYDLKYDGKGSSRYRPERRVSDDWDAHAAVGNDRLYVTENVYAKCDEGIAHMQRVSETASPELLKRTTDFMRKSYMDIHFRRSIIYAAYVDNVFWRFDPVRAIYGLLSLAEEWTILIERTGRPSDA